MTVAKIRAKYEAALARWSNRRSRLQVRLDNAQRVAVLALYVEIVGLDDTWRHRLFSRLREDGVCRSCGGMESHDSLCDQKATS